MAYSNTAPISPKAKLVCERLVRDNLLRADQLDAILSRIEWSGERAEEVILDLGLASEAELLKSLAGLYRVHFVSSEKLAKAEVARAVINTIPQRFAEKVGVCPVAFDPRAHALSVVTADPDDTEALSEVQLASGAREVTPVLARPAAVRALIAKVYGGDTRAFQSVVRPNPTLPRGGAASRHVVVDRMDHNGRVPSPSQSRLAAIKDPRAAKAEPKTLGLLSSKPPSAAGEGGAAPRVPTEARAPSVEGGGRVEPPRRPADAPPTRSSSSESVVAKRPAAEAKPARGAEPSDKGVSQASFVELLHVLVSLIETSRADLRGHSALVARLVRRMAEKLGLEPAATATMIAGAFVHDLGKAGAYHLTALNCAEYEGHKVAAQKAHGLPARLLEPVRLPDAALAAVNHMYERFDGKGFPGGLAGKDIPLGARVLAICDTYADLTSNPRNPFRKVLPPAEACAVLAKHKETIFDPNLVDLFKTTVLGEELAARLLASRGQSLVVDVDPEETTVLELRMTEQGFVVKTARTREQALKILAEGEIDLVVSEIDLGDGDGLALLEQARGESWGKEIAWVVYTRRQERAIAQRAFELGVLDYVAKPASADVLVAKLKALLDQRATRSSRGVSGSLREMGLPDMVQVLFHGRKSGNLKIRARDGVGEIHFAEGNVVHALWRDLRGEDAFYAMLRIADGDFALDPSFKPTERVIDQSSEALLLEGMRRMDEGL